ncbi:MFS transporter [Streptomyces sp. NBC_00470]|uniref:MFS transporter n=1 Tax=Streptomyces sp. NBC_00470 TaxID=2975753 RepID=UPI002F912711
MSAPTARTPSGQQTAGRGAYVYISVFSAALYTVLLIAPVVTGRLADEYGLSTTQLGLLSGAEMGAFSLASLPAYLWLRRINLRTATYIGVAGIVVGDVASGFVTDSFGWLLAFRVITSLAAGSITVILLSLSGRTPNPSRAYGLFTVCQLAMGALILAVFPMLFADAPVGAIYWTLAGITALCLPAVRLIDGNLMRDPSATSQGAATGRVPATSFLLGMLAIGLFYVALSGVWTFMEQVSTGAGNPRTGTALVLSVATIAGVLSALLATLLGDSLRRAICLGAGYAGLAVSVLLLFGAPTLLRFAAAAVLFKFAWTWILPYLLSGLSQLGGGSDHVMTTTNLMIGGGFLIGPLLAGRLSAGGDFTPMLTLSAVSVLISMGLALGARPRATAPALAPATAA